MDSPEKLLRALRSARSTAHREKPSVTNSGAVFSPSRRIYLFLLLITARPPTTLFAAFAGSLSLYTTNPGTPIGTHLSLIGVLASMVAGGFLVNDYFDLDRDRINKKDRPVVRGDLPSHYALAAGLALFTFSLILALTLDVLSFSLSIANVILLLLYSPIAARLHGIVKNLTVAYLSSTPIFLGGLLGGSLFYLWPAGFVLFVVVLSRELVFDIDDIEGDLATGVRTVAVVRGAHFTFHLAKILLVAATVVLAALVVVGGLESPSVFVLSSACAFFLLGRGIRRYQVRRDRIAYMQFGITFSQSCFLVCGLVIYFGGVTSLAVAAHEGHRNALLLPLVGLAILGVTIKTFNRFNN